MLHLPSGAVSQSVLFTLSAEQRPELNLELPYYDLYGLFRVCPVLAIIHLIENIKQTWIQDYKTCYNDK
jgi:hypothetical protein